MARIRSIKPEFWVSEQIAECSTSARLTFVGMWAFCDDNGVHPAKPKTLKAELFPMDDFSSSDVEGWVQELVKVGLVAKFNHEGVEFWHVTGWAKHQKIDRPSYKYPAPPAAQTGGQPQQKLDEPSANAATETEGQSARTRQSLDEDSTKTRRAPPPGVESIGVESIGVEKAASPKARRAPAMKPKTTMPSAFTVSDAVKAWAASKGFGDLDRKRLAIPS
jgi:hypothetical protein